MFMVFSKEKILSYLISLSTVALLFVLSFAITKKNDEILKTSANAVISNNIENLSTSTENVELETFSSGLNPNEKAQQNLIQSDNSNINKKDS